ncbi:glucokinase 1-like protein [Leptomonas pyrrhocoris]|uniref:Glucokinase 1-like protein n=1 Tax=Leptomonas pyrrhocoris TaxID=157538 RepID=A0A0N0DVD7_LEPPY|nr:glucokinase 1-like protein [Leptomonas pyrrhocoris]KPA80192.1 glucokinase 1-like protein [Leptomonas pyrrhocoris]|eukprot:XP_015658631.1 glucokinase 1-like protein [Leptomonas pyrrhocoris]
MAQTEEIELSELAATLGAASWSTGPIYAVCDIGGTNARIGFAQSTKRGRGLQVTYVRFKVTKKDVRQLVEFFELVLHELKTKLPNRGAAFFSRITSGAVSVPGPVTNSKVAGPFNNLKGIANVEDYPAELFPKGRSALLNDLEAGGYGVLALSNTGLLSKYFTVMWKGSQWDAMSDGKAPGTTLGKGRCLIAAPGTGLGSSLIHYMGVSDSYVVLPLEGGSTSIAWCAGSEGEYAQTLATFQASKRPEITPAVAPHWESATNGNGLQFNYAYEFDGTKTSSTSPHFGKTAPEVAKLAKSGADPAAIAAMDRLYKNLMGFCAESTMQFMPLTCVLMGDTIALNSFYFEDPARVQALQARLYEHTMERPYKFISRTTFLRQVRSVNLNLIGCLGFGTQLSQPAKVPSNL